MATASMTIPEHAKATNAASNAEIATFFRTKVTELRSLFASAGVALESGNASRPALVDPATVTVDQTVAPFTSNSFQYLSYLSDYYRLSNDASPVYLQVDYGARRVTTNTSTTTGTYYANIYFRVSWSISASGFAAGTFATAGFFGNPLNSTAALTSFNGLSPSPAQVTHHPGFLAVGYGSASSSLPVTEGFFSVERHHDSAGVVQSGSDAALTAVARVTATSVNTSPPYTRVTTMRASDSAAVAETVTTGAPGSGVFAAPHNPAGVGGGALYGDPTKLAVYPQLYFGVRPGRSRYTQGLATSAAPAGPVSMSNPVGGGSALYRTAPHGTFGNYSILVRE